MRWQYAKRTEAPEGDKISETGRRKLGWPVSLFICMASCGVMCVDSTVGQTIQGNRRPNVVYILADDLGYGDVRSYAPNSQVDTPNIDRLARNGMRFTNAHSSSSVCTPTRYSLLTGQYTWRTRLTAGIVSEMGPSLVDQERLTVADMLQESGYSTAAIGKWHLGMDWTTTDGRRALRDGSNIDYMQPFSGGPLDHGFDTYFGDGTINTPPYTFIRDDRTLGIPQPDENGNAFKPQGGDIAGFVTPEFRLVDVMPTITHEATSYIQQQAAAEDPFFLYLPLTAPHVPISPPDFIRGSTGKGLYGDFIATVDWTVGEVLKQLEDPNGDGDTGDSIVDETMVVFTSDNGAQTSRSFSQSVGFRDGQLLRGDKSTIYEGGHRVPLIVQWPGQVQAESTTDALVELNDFMGTMADAVEYPLPNGAAEDSFNLLPLMRGASDVGREFSVHHSIRGAFAISQVDEQHHWKLIFTPDDGGFGGTSGVSPLSDIDFSLLQLYELSSDPSERNNLLLSEDFHDKAVELRATLKSFIEEGRSQPESPVGDFNRDQTIDARDIDMLSRAVNASRRFAAFDLNDDSRVDETDRQLWIRDVAVSVPGDANLDGRFDPSDLIHVFRIDRYEDDVEHNSGWSEGDWNGDGDFDSNDLIYALRAGAYQSSTVANYSVPEPNSSTLLIFAVVLLPLRTRARRLG